MASGSGVYDEQENAPSPPRVKRKLTSVLWNEFNKVLANGELKVECVWCHVLLGGDSKNGTSHLHAHLARCESRKANAWKQAKLKLTKGEDGKVNVENYVFDQELCRKQLALMLCCHEYPLSIVDHAGFRKFCSILQPMFKVVSRQTIRKDIIEMHEGQRDKMIKYFANFKNRVAVTSDLWTTGHQRRGYMAVTAHYIDGSWNLKSFLLSFVYVPAPHTAAVLCEVLHEVLVEFHLERKISTITLDNCTTNDKAVEELQDKLDSSSLMLGGKMLHMRCCAHILNLIVKDGLAVLGDGIERVRDSVGFWSATPKRHEKFEKTCRLMNIDYSKRLSLDCKTRWNSTYIMLSIAVLYREVFDRLSLREKQFNCCPSTADWNFAKEMIERLKLFYDITSLWSGKHYVTANLFFPKVCGINLAIRKWTTPTYMQLDEMPEQIRQQYQVMQQMSEEMKKKFDKYWSDVHGLMAIATVLDPRYKLHMLQALYGSLYGPEAACTEVARVKVMLRELLVEYQDDSSAATTSGASAEPAVKQGEDEVFDIFDQYMSSQPAVSAMLVHTELDLYLEEPTLPRTKDFDIINWWKFGGIKYPTLQLIAHDILPIPVTTVASESAFSTSGRILSPHRSRLAPKCVEAIMCMQAWCNADMLGNSKKTCLDNLVQHKPKPITVLSSNFYIVCNFR
ncbi:hypothetical protein ACQ4PT_016531 [Festuca glaucescens]